MSESALDQPIRVTALQTAVTQLGQKESPGHNNTGTMVDQYLKSVGLRPGYSWCQAFVYWCYEQAALRLGVLNPVIHTAGVIDCWNRSNYNQKIIKTKCISNPELIFPGYQFILNFGEGHGHTGIIESIKGSMLTTIEGNSNNNGSPDGFEVVRHTRDMNKKEFIGVITY